MQYLAVIIVAALVFGVCYLCDKAFDRAFRNKQQHKSGLAIRLSKRYAAFGAILIVLGVVALFTAIGNSTLLMVGSVIIMLMGTALIVYYATFGVFYDSDSFIYTTFGNKSLTYCYRDIVCQQLYITGGSTVIELQMTDGKAIQLQTTMLGVYPFLDIAFAGWRRQKGISEADCPFYDPANSCWFPSAEEA